MYSPRLQRLYQSLSTNAQAHITKIGITSVLETNAWDSVEEFVPSTSFTAGLVAELHDFWLASQGACAMAARRAVLDFAAAPQQQRVEHVDLYLHAAAQNSSSTSCAPAPLQSFSTTKRRRLKAASVSETELHLQSLQLRERKVVEAAASELWALFLEVGAHGSQWSDYVALTPSDKEQFAAMFFDDMCLVALPTLQAALRLMRRWRRHCAESNIEPWKPSSIHVAIWLRSLQERGPTAPHGAYATLKWVEKKLGFDFHSSSDRVRGQSAVPQCHTESQAKPLTLSIILGLESLVGSQNHAVGALALTWLLLTYAVLRFAHLQRSVILRVLDNGIAAKASLGKRRSQGRRRPFEWRAPRWGVTGCDLGSAVHQHLARNFGGEVQPGFFLSDFSPPRCTLQTATGFSTKSMSLGRFSRLSQHMFQQAPFGLSAMDAALLTSYSARRVLPTIAELARLDPHEMLLVGDWKGARKECLDISMPMRYADQKLHTSLCVKTELVCIIQHVSRHGHATDTWDGLSANFPPRLESKRLASHVLQNGRAAIYLPEDGGLLPDPNRDLDSSSASPSTSGSDSDSSSSDTQAEECHEIQRLLSKGRQGHLHVCKPLQSQTERWHTHCNRGLKDPDVGVGLEDAFSTGRPWSPRCFNHLPKKLQKAWQDMGHSGR